MTTNLSYRTANSLTVDERVHCQTLIERCHHYDHTAKDPYLNQQFNYFPDLPAFILAYANQQLVGVAILYADSDPQSAVPAEVSLFVDPDYRHHGIGHHLQQLAMQLLQRAGYTTIYYVSEAVFLDQHPTFLSRWQLKSTPQVEVQLTLGLSHPFPPTITSTDTVRPMLEKDLTTLLPAYATSFEIADPQVARTYLQGTYQDPASQAYVLLNQDQLPIGYAAFNLSQDRYAYLFGLFIAPAYRNQGLSQKFLTALWPQLIAQQIHQVKLAVESDNDLAQHLYHQVGFQTETQIVYLTAQTDES